MDVIDFDVAIEAWRAYVNCLPKAGDVPVLPFDLRPFQDYACVSKAHRAAGLVGCCPVCGAKPGERGFVRFNWPIGHVFFGRAVKCPRCWSE